MRSAKGQNVVNLVLGLWLFFSPWIFGTTTIYADLAAMSWNFWIVGAVIAISAGLALRDLRPWEEWTNLILGVWLLISPWVLGYTLATALFWNALIVGAAVVVFSGTAIPVAQQRVQHSRA